MTAKFLFSQWNLKPGEKDITIMQIIVQGEKNGKTREYRWDLLDKYDTETQTHSMARTTGYTATTVLRLLKEGLFNKKGIITPEIIGKDEVCVKFILEKLQQRNIVYRPTITDL